MVERPAGGEDERVFGVRLLDRALVLDGEELGAPSSARRARSVEEPGGLAADLGHRPLDPVLLEPVVADAVPVRCEIGELVPDGFGVRILGPARA